jgi:hypothetical protein
MMKICERDLIEATVTPVMRTQALFIDLVCMYTV